MGMYNMKDEEILKKAIEKAVKSGWKNPDKKVCEVKFCNGVFLHFGAVDIMFLGYRNDIIFSHDFAKFFWGEGTICKDCEDSLRICRINLSNDCGYEGTGNSQRAWEYHLQQMVLEEDKLKYLEKFLK